MSCFPNVGFIWECSLVFTGDILGKSHLPAKNNGESCNSSKQIHVATGANFVYLFIGGACVGLVYLKNLEVE